MFDETNSKKLNFTFYISLLQYFSDNTSASFDKSNFTLKGETINSLSIILLRPSIAMNYIAINKIAKHYLFIPHNSLYVDIKIKNPFLCFLPPFSTRK